jgi:hypothetical protein
MLWINHDCANVAALAKMISEIISGQAYVKHNSAFSTCC